MLKIRLARIGKRKKPTYRFIVSESARDVFGKALEILGHYDPFSKVCEVKKDRILYWISQGAQVSPTAHNLLVDQNVITAPKVKASKAGKKGDEAGGQTPQAAVKTQGQTVSETKPAPEPKPGVGQEEKSEVKSEEKVATEEKPAAEEKSVEPEAKKEAPAA